MIEYSVIKSKRKSIGIKIERDCTVTVHCPLHTPKSVIEKSVLDNEKWILAHLKQRAEYNEAHPEDTPEEISALKAKAKAELPSRVEYYSKIMGVAPTHISITSAKTRFGSCSGKNAICFSYNLMKYPQSAIDYVVVHELAHIKHHNHSKQFYDFVSSVLPDYKQREQLLRK